MIICSNTFHFFASQKCQVDPGGHFPRAGGRGVIVQREMSVIFQRGVLVIFQRGICYFPTQESCLGPAACITWITWFLGFLVSGFPGFWVSWFRGFLLSGFPGFWVSWFLGFRVYGFPGFWVPCFWVSCFLGIPTLNKETSHKHQINSKQTLNKS